MSGPTFAVAPHEAVVLALLRARVKPADEPPPGYNDRRGRLWVRLAAHRTLPTSKEFEAEWRLLRDTLIAAGAEAPGHRLAPALDMLDQVWGAASQSGLLDAWN